MFVHYSCISDIGWSFFFFILVRYMLVGVCIEPNEELSSLSIHLWLSF